MGKYKEKNCKFCQKPHQKRGPYCCQACANRDRPEYSPKVAQAMRKVATEYKRTPEAIAKQKQLNTSLASMTVDEFAVGIPDVSTLDDYYEHTEGFDRAEDW